MLKLRDALSRWEASELSQLEAAELLGMSERTFRRWARRLEEEGEEGLIDRRLGRRSGRAVPDAICEKVEELYRERYSGFTAKHFHEHLEHLVRDHGFRWGTPRIKSGAGCGPRPIGRVAACWHGRRGAECTGASGRGGR